MSVFMRDLGDAPEEKVGRYESLSVIPIDRIEWMTFKEGGVLGNAVWTQLGRPVLLPLIPTIR